jgi:hypothetical protein
MISNPKGNYDFIPGSPYLSFGVVAQPGFTIERAVFRKNRLVETGLEEVARHLRSRGRTLQALCAMEFRQFAQHQWAPEGFAAFNAGHVSRLTQAGLTVEGKVPVARTNVIVNNGQPASDGGLHAFSYTVPQERPVSGRSFVLAAIPEVRFLPQGMEIIAEGDTSDAALESKLRFILEKASERVAEIGGHWNDVTGTQLYCEVDIHPFLRNTVLHVMQGGGWRGVQWHQALPPIGPAIMELDVRSVTADIYLD